MQVESNLDSTSEEAPDVETPEPEVDPVDTELSQLRGELDQQRNNASQKITELGEARSGLEQQVQLKDQQIAQLQQQLQHSQQPSNYEYSEDEGQARINQAVQEMAPRFIEMEQRLQGYQQREQEDAKVTEMQQQFGVSVEDARLAKKFFDDGEIQKGYRLLELNSIRNKRKEAAPQRDTAAPPPSATSNSTRPAPATDTADLVSQMESGQMSFSEKSRILAANPDLLNEIQKRRG
jgi:hypothetical protein